MSDCEIVGKLIARDNKVTDEFFFKGKNKAMFYGLIKALYSDDSRNVDYDEFINELYLYLISDDAKILRSFKFKSTLSTWIWRVAYNFFLKLKINRKVVIDEANPNTQNCINTEKMSDNTTGIKDFTTKQLMTILDQMTTKRYAKVMYELFFKDLIEDVEKGSVTSKDLAIEMDTSVDNIYNIKSRAYKQFVKTAIAYLKDHPEEFDEKY